MQRGSHRAPAGRTSLHVAAGPSAPLTMIHPPSNPCAIRDGERKRERVLLTSALICCGALACARPDLRRRTFIEATASGMHSWGSRGRRFKSGRPDAGQRADSKSGVSHLVHLGTKIDGWDAFWRFLTGSQGVARSNAIVPEFSASSV